MSCKCGGLNYKLNKNHAINLLIGNPNVGKSTFFNRITWQNSPIGNIDKITVNAKLGTLKGDKEIKFLDLPGVYTLNPLTNEESIVIDSIINGVYNKIINIISVSSLKRDLYLTLDLLETQRLRHLFINMIDEVEVKNLNPFVLISQLGVDVKLISSTQNKNIKEGIASIINFHNSKTFKFYYDEKIEKMIEFIESKIHFDTNKLPKRFFAIQFLLNNSYIHNLFAEQGINDSVIEYLKSQNLTVDETKLMIKKQRLEFIQSLVEKFFHSKKIDIKKQKKEFRDNKFDKLMLNKYFGIFLFIVVLILIYYLTFGKYAGGFINEVWTGVLDLGMTKVNEAILNTNINNAFWVARFVSDGLLGGIFTVIGFLPYIMIMYLLMTILEHSGFLARISILLDKALEKYGLSGRSIITLLTGVGCNIPSVMMTRNSQSRKERIILILITPLIACSARLVVYQWIAEAIFNVHVTWLISLALTLFSAVVAIFVSCFFSNTLFRKQNSFFMTEMPKWRRPSFVLIMKGMGIEVWNFIKRVTTIIFVINLVMFFLLFISPTTGLINSEEGISGSLLYYVSLPFKYFLYPTGLGQDWKITMSLITAAPAKEIAASNLELFFGSQQGFYQFLFNSQTIIAPVATTFTYLLFFTFYIPCFATLVVLRKEAGRKWFWINLLTAMVVSYVISLLAFSSIGLIELLIKYPHEINQLTSILAVVYTIASFIMFIVFIANNFVVLYKKQVSAELLNYTKIYWKVYVGVQLLSVIINLSYLYSR